MDDKILSSDWINPRERFYPKKSNLEPPVDELVSEVVGKKIYQRDPRLIKLILKWKADLGKSEESMQPDNFLDDPRKITELREALK